MRVMYEFIRPDLQLYRVDLNSAYVRVFMQLVLDVIVDQFLACEV